MGHAVDNVDDRYLSEQPEFLDKFNEFTRLAQKYEYESLKDIENINFEEYQNGVDWGSMVVGFKNHALDNEKEFFASLYADMNYSF